MADTAAAIARNSAAMSKFDKPTLSIVYHYIVPKVDVRGVESVPGTPLAANASKKSIAPSASVPGLYYVHPVNEQVALGFSINSYFGLSTDYKSTYAASELANKTSIKTYYFTPHISFKPTENLSLGLGINYIYGEGEIKNTFSNIAATAVSGAIGAPGIVSQGDTLLDLKGDGDAAGYTLGLQWDIAESTRLGLRYQSSVDLKLEGKVGKFVTPLQNADLHTPVGVPGAIRSKGKLTLNLPSVIELGFAHDINDKFTVMAGLQKTGWHSFRQLEGDIKAFKTTQHLKDEQWQDAYRISLGGEWHTSDSLTLRAGLGLDESPVLDEYRSLSIPDAERKWFTGGATVRMGDAGGLDFAIAYLRGGKVSVDENSQVGTNFKGRLSKTDAFIYSIGYNISF
jgi:long-chain fatty acid transport protein